MSHDKDSSPSEPAKGVVTIDSLPEEILAVVFKRLADMVDKEGGDRQKVFLPLLTGNGRVQSEAELQFLTRCTRLERLNLSFILPESDALTVICEAQLARNLKFLTIMPVIRDKQSLTRLLENLAKLRNLVSIGFNWTLGDLSDWSPSMLNIDRPLELRTLGLQHFGQNRDSESIALRALQSILAADALVTVQLTGWRGDRETVAALTDFPNLQSLTISFVNTPEVANGLRAMPALESLRDLLLRCEWVNTIVKSPSTIRKFLSCLPTELEQALTRDDTERRFIASTTPLDRPTWRLIRQDGGPRAKPGSTATGGGTTEGAAIEADA
ncbi:hypothetical protein JCM10908_006412 [Rhodotorula pacifica]|uniref:uncharacterized protein n=1 Tax=Rhodotorula pacifica TaxID=1495444 RepID=UPI003179EFB2